MTKALPSAPVAVAVVAETQLRLVLEMCDVGNLKDFLGRGGFRLADGQHDMVAIVATALDIARAMHHLHTENIIHSDLKVCEWQRGCCLLAYGWQHLLLVHSALLVKLRWPVCLRS